MKIFHIFAFFASTIIIVAILLLCRIKEPFETTPTPPTTSPSSAFSGSCETTPVSEAELIKAQGERARDACNRISSKADEIKAVYGGITNIYKNLPGFALLNPNNWRAGDTKVEDLGTRIINTNLSSCEITKIKEIVEQIASSSQQNIIDNTKCTYCNPSPELLMDIINATGRVPDCSITGVKQININEVKQTATLNSLINTLLNKKLSVDAQALARVLQEAQGSLSGDQTWERKPCDTIDTDMSTKQYFEKISSCVQKANNIQENTINFCGNLGDVIQQNQSSILQSCLGDVKKQVTQNLDVTKKAGQDIDLQQKSTGGIDLNQLIMIGIIIGVVLLILSSILGSIFLFKKKSAVTINPLVNPAYNL